MHFSWAELSTLEKSWLLQLAAILPFFIINITLISQDFQQKHIFLTFLAAKDSYDIQLWPIWYKQKLPENFAKTKCNTFTFIPDWNAEVTTRDSIAILWQIHHKEKAKTILDPHPKHLWVLNSYHQANNFLLCWNKYNPNFIRLLY